MFPTPVSAVEGLVVFIAGEYFFLQDMNLSFRLLLVVYIISTGLPIFYEYFHITTSILLALLKGSLTLPSSCLCWSEIIYLEPDFKLWQDSSFIFNYHLFLTYSLNLWCMSLCHGAMLSLSKFPVFYSYFQCNMDF